MTHQILALPVTLPRTQIDVPATIEFTYSEAERAVSIHRVWVGTPNGEDDAIDVFSGYSIPKHPYCWSALHQLEADVCEYYETHIQAPGEAY